MALAEGLTTQTKVRKWLAVWEKLTIRILYFLLGGILPLELFSWRRLQCTEGAQ